MYFCYNLVMKTEKNKDQGGFILIILVIVLVLIGLLVSYMYGSYPKQDKSQSVIQQGEEAQKQLKTSIDAQNQAGKEIQKNINNTEN